MEKMERHGIILEL